jgi:hypothetical protein
MYVCIVSRVTLNGYIYYFPVLCTAPKVLSLPPKFLKVTPQKTHTKCG